LIFPFCADATPPVHHHGGVRAPLPVSPVSDSVVVLFTAGVFPGLLIGSVPSGLFHSIPHSVDVRAT